MPPWRIKHTQGLGHNFAEIFSCFPKSIFPPQRSQRQKAVCAAAGEGPAELEPGTAVHSLSCPPHGQKGPKPWEVTGPM